jgi:hypothetical protein
MSPLLGMWKLGSHYYFTRTEMLIGRRLLFQSCGRRTGMDIAVIADSVERPGYKCTHSPQRANVRDVQDGNEPLPSSHRLATHLVLFSG